VAQSSTSRALSLPINSTQLALIASAWRDSTHFGTSGADAYRDSSGFFLAFSRSRHCEFKGDFYVNLDVRNPRELPYDHE